MGLVFFKKGFSQTFSSCDFSRVVVADIDVNVRMIMSMIGFSFSQEGTSCRDAFPSLSISRSNIVDMSSVNMSMIGLSFRIDERYKFFSIGQNADRAVFSTGVKFFGEFSSCLVDRYTQFAVIDMNMELVDKSRNISVGLVMMMNFNVMFCMSQTFQGSSLSSCNDVGNTGVNCQIVADVLSMRNIVMNLANNV